VAAGRQRARAEGVFADCRGLTPELIVAKLERALELAYADGAASMFRPARANALREMRSALAGLETSIKQHTRTCEIELAELEKKP
jgi:hypothetical protein